jgi:hypothetical protein
MPRCFIIAIASGGICGMLDISMLVVTVQSPALPCAARAATGTRIRLEAIKAESDARFMTFPLFPSWTNLAEQWPGVNFRCRLLP